MTTHIELVMCQILTVQSSGVGGFIVDERSNGKELYEKSEERGTRFNGYEDKIP